MNWGEIFDGISMVFHGGALTVVRADTCGHMASLTSGREDGGGGVMYRRGDLSRITSPLNKVTVPSSPRVVGIYYSIFSHSFIDSFRVAFYAHFMQISTT